MHYGFLAAIEHKERQRALRRDLATRQHLIACADCPNRRRRLLGDLLHRLHLAE